MFKTLLRSAILLTLTTASAAQADASLTLQYHQGEGPQQLFVHQQRVIAPLVQGQRVIWDTQKGDIILVNDKKAETITVNQNTMAGINQMMGQISAQMEALPKAQRDMLAKALGMPSGNSSAAPSISLVPSGQTRSVTGISCKLHTIQQNAVSTGEVCLAKPQAVKMSSSDYNTLIAMFELSRGFASQSANLNLGSEFALLGALPKLVGIPMAIKLPQQGLVTSIKQINTTDAVNKTLYSVPAHYKQVDPLSFLQPK